MKSYKYRAWLTGHVIFCFYFLWQTLNSTNDNVGFFFNLGAAIGFFSGFLESWRNPAELARLGMTFPEIYQDVKKSGYRTPFDLHILGLLVCILFGIAAYYKFFAH